VPFDPEPILAPSAVNVGGDASLALSPKFRGSRALEAGKIQ